MPINESYGKEIFNIWLKIADNDDLKRRFKEWISKSTTEGLSYETTVKSSNLFLIAKIQVDERSADMETKEPKHIVAISQVGSKGPFYEFDRPIEYENWKGKPFVKFYKSLKPYNCSECEGKGYENCHCKAGMITCSKCKGKTAVQCTNCMGKKKKADKVTITDGHSGKKTVTEHTFNCSMCYGVGVVTCTNCAGQGKIGHTQCHFSGKLGCKTCRGTGQIVDIYEEPVPIKASRDEIYITRIKKLEEHEQVVELLNKYKLHKLEVNRATIKMKDLDAISEHLGKDSEKIVKQVNKTLKNLLNEKNKLVTEPIVFYTGWRLLCKSTKGHNFELWSIGDQKNFHVVAIGFS